MTTMADQPAQCIPRRLVLKVLAYWQPLVVRSSKQSRMRLEALTGTSTRTFLRPREPAELGCRRGAPRKITPELRTERGRSAPSRVRRSVHRYKGGGIGAFKLFHSTARAKGLSKTTPRQSVLPPQALGGHAPAEEQGGLPCRHSGPRTTAEPCERGQAEWYRGK